MLAVPSVTKYVGAAYEGFVVDGFRLFCGYGAALQRPCHWTPGVGCRGKRGMQGWLASGAAGIRGGGRRGTAGREPFSDGLGWTRAGADAFAGRGCCACP